MKHKLLLFFFIVLFSCNQSNKSDENCLSKENEKSLVALGQLWGFLKYHHPVVAEGKLDWDTELIKIIPVVMNAKNEDEWKNSLDNWVDSLPTFAVIQKDNVPSSKIIVKADCGELFNTEYFNQKTIDKLQFVLDSAHIEENQFARSCFI